MENSDYGLSDIVNKCLNADNLPLRRKVIYEKARPLEVEFAGETLAPHNRGIEVEVSWVVIYIPKEIIQKYNILIGADAKSLPDADEFWNALHPTLMGKDIIAKDDGYGGSYDPIDTAVNELING